MFYYVKRQFPFYSKYPVSLILWATGPVFPNRDYDSCRL